MKATEKQILELAVAYQQCIDTLVSDMVRHRNALTALLRTEEVHNEHDYTEFGEQAFMWKLKELADTQATIDANMAEVKRLLNP